MLQTNKNKILKLQYIHTPPVLQKKEKKNTLHPHPTYLKKYEMQNQN